MYSAIIIKSQTNSYSGPKNGTKYDLSNACPSCGTGARAVGPRFLKLAKVPKYEIFQTLDGEVFISEKLKLSFEAELPESKAFLWPVVNSVSQEPLPLWEIRAELILPKFAISTTGFEIEKSCKECARDGHFGVPNISFKPAYPEAQVSKLTANVLCTWEHFGLSKLRPIFEDSVFAAPILIVSDQFRNVIESHKIAGVVFEKICLI